ncbi:MAG: hypothetical protein VYC34_11220, partial [Planctomycetota bacterium]|nr:hypothetical protein [Planctomycetota bacterium]
MQDVRQEHQAEQLRAFMKALLRDLQALEEMLNRGMIESDARRIGAEQEMFLIDSGWRPAPMAEETLAKLDDPRFAPELGKFNLEANVDPLLFRGDCLSRMERQLEELVARARDAARDCGADVLLTGILPTLTKGDLGLENMMPRPRYAALNEGLTRLRGGEYEFHIKGSDELIIKHDSVMLEACNASFQAHFQVAPAEFARLYNISQAALGPVMAASTNSPLLFGRRLWRETRIALFQQSVDTRNTPSHLRELAPRVSFGTDWAKGDVLEVYREDVARFRAFMTTDIDEDPFECIARGEAPRLSALRLHNSTVYRWNRACYGVADGKAHLRIENRVLPSGPTIRDEVANAALWFGLVAGLADECEDVTARMSFEDAKSNFFDAARHGLAARQTWFDEESLPADTLILEKLAPLARRGLESAGVDSADIETYLGVIEARVRSGNTPSKWALRSLSAMPADASRGEKMRAITAAMASRQQGGTPAHEWDPARAEEAGCWTRGHQRVEQYMTTDLFTVNQDELIDLVAAVMDWRHIRHVPVEDDQ